MNSLTKFIASISALIASVSFAWLALTTTGMIPNYSAKVTVYHKGDIGLGGSVELESASGGFHVENEIITWR
jgi:hypothetical protein